MPSRRQAAGDTWNCIITILNPIFAQMSRHPLSSASAQTATRLPCPTTVCGFRSWELDHVYHMNFPRMWICTASYLAAITVSLSARTPPCCARASGENMEDIFTMEIPEPGSTRHHHWNMAHCTAGLPNPFCWIGHVMSRTKQLRMGLDTHMGEINIWKNRNTQTFTLDPLARSGLDFGPSPQRIRIVNERTIQQDTSSKIIYRPDISWPIERVLKDLEQLHSAKDWNSLLSQARRLP